MAGGPPAQNSRSCSLRKDPGCGSPKLESQDPFTRNRTAITFWRTEFPPPRGLQGLPGKISARSGGIERRVRHAAGSIESDSHADMQRALKSVSRFLGHIGKDLMNDFSWNKVASACLHSGRIRFSW